MLNTAATTRSSTSDSYLDRNLPWLIPAVFTLMLFTLPALVEIIGIQFALPKWLYIAGAVFCAFLTGLRMMFVNTISARIVGFVGTGLVLGTVVAAIFY